VRLLRIFPRNSDNHATDIIRCEIFHASMSENLEFKALSYAWGKNDKQYSILLNGLPFLVHHNLYTALLQISSWSTATPITIWIDAICIDQSNIPERSQQVRNMRCIYSQAEEVVVWLGPHSENSHCAFHILRDFLILARHPYSTLVMCKYLEYTEPVGDPEVAKGLRALADLFLRDYWYRMWIVQELTVARHITIHVGDCAAPGAAVIKVQELLRDLPSGKLETCLDYDEFPRNALVLQGMLDIMEWKQALGKREMTFHDCLRYHQLRNCTNPRDKLYALAAITRGQSEFNLKIDYAASVKEVYTDFARAEIGKSKKLDVITSVHRGDGLNPHNLPSWVPDWSDESLKIHTFLSDTKHGFSSAGQTVADFSFDDTNNILWLKGISIGQISQLGRVTQMADVQGYIDGVKSIYAWWQMHEGVCAVSDHMSCVQRFVRTIRCDFYSNNEDFQSKASEVIFADIFSLPDRYLTHVSKESPEWYDPDPVIEDLKKRIHKKRAQEAAKDEIGWVNNSSLPYEQLCRQLLPSFVKLWDRRFFILLDGTFGMAPFLARKDDIICIPLGCPSPIVLRPEGDHFVLIGEAYLDGYMYGEVVESGQALALGYQKFEIH
jgi:hypothetical protein